jgi:predicted flavoprotein YhiN
VKLSKQSDGMADGHKSWGQWTAAAVIVATGGASYPATGSTGDGIRLAEKLGHSIVPLLPSLVPLETEEPWVRALQGSH